MNFDELMAKVTEEPLSKTLPIALRLAISINEPDFVKWVKLELNGYFNTNPELTEDVVVPEYRTVAGHHSDDFGRPLIIHDLELAFINTTRLRFGVADLEKLSDENSNYSYRDPKMSEIIKKGLNVDVTAYTFHSSQAAGVLSGIQTELIERLLTNKGKIEKVSGKGIMKPTEDILELKPNFYGIGVNLNALARKWKDHMSRNRD